MTGSKTSVTRRLTTLLSALLLCLLTIALSANAQTTTTPRTNSVSEADRLRGEYGPYRANNDLLYYHLDVRVDPDHQMLSGKNVIRFRMLEPGTRIQLDLVPVFNIDKIVLDEPGGGTRPLKFERAAGRTVYVDFPDLKKGDVVTIEFYYSGHPVEMGRFGGFVFRKDPMGRPLANTACEEEGASVWWPNKDQCRGAQQSCRSLQRPLSEKDRSRGRLHALGLARQLSHQQLRCLAERRHLRPLRRHLHRSVRHAHTRLLRLP